MNKALLIFILQFSIFGSNELANAGIISGSVTDGSGQGWPLYARIDINGYPKSPIFTDPVTGTYAVDLTEGTVFTFHVSGVSPGYNSESRDVTPPVGGDIEDFALTVNQTTCNAPGYDAQCNALPGGLLLGNVYDVNTGLGVNRARVSSDDQPNDTAATFPTPDDVNVDDGFYILFSTISGSHDFTAFMPKYSSDTETVDVIADNVVSQNFTLSAGILDVDPDSIEATVFFGNEMTVSVAITNNGTAPVNFEIQERYGLANNVGRSKHTPSDAPWTDIANYPIAIMDNSAAEIDGKIYSVGGFDGINVLGAGAVYDPETNSWSSIANMSGSRQKPAVAGIGGLLYVTNGLDSGGVPDGTLEIYDPATDSWSLGAPIPIPMGEGSVGLNFADKFYVIGGCDAFSCGFRNVQIYDPGSETWSFAPDYPEDTSWLACGDIGGQIYCAGGVSDALGESMHTYVYDPGIDLWSQLADVPQPQWAMGYISADDLLYISGGITNSTITNEGFSYDPNTDIWTPIANSNNTVSRGGSACGFYRIGGSTDGSNPIANSELYPDLTTCGSGVDVPWLTEDPNTGVVNPGEAVNVDVTLDASQLSQPGDYFAHLTIKEDTPYPAAVIPITMHVIFQELAILTGTVIGLERCDAAGNPIDGATVFIDGPLQDLTLQTDPNGFYMAFIDPFNSPVDVTASASGYIAQTVTGIVIILGQTTVQDFSLRKDAPCASASPSFFDVTPGLNEQITLPLTLTNAGAGTLDFSIDESQLLKAVDTSDVPWVSENPTSGSVPPDSSTTVDITFDSTGLADGDYSASLVISTNDPGASPITIPLTLHVITCTYSNDFNNGVLEWIEEKPEVTEPGDGLLHLSPLKKKAIGVADSSFAGASTGTYTFDVQFTGGIDAKNWLYITRFDKKNQLEVLFKVEAGKVVVKDRNQTVLAKSKADFTFAPNTPYNVVINYDGTNVDVTINGTAVIVDFVPTRTLPTANIGGAAKLNDLLIDNVCVQ